MPIYDFKCKNCGLDWNTIMNFDVYEEFDSHTCSGCGTEVTKDERVMGVSKGNYNGRDYT